MNLGRKIIPKNLSDWLEIATGELVPSAQARVRAEIEAHVADAVQRHREPGLADSSAQAAALTDLGNARAAAHRFAREYLTQRDIRKLGDFDRPRGEVLLRHVALLCILVFGWHALHVHNSHDDLYYQGPYLLFYSFVYFVMAAAFAVFALRTLSAFWLSPVTVARRILSLRLVLILPFLVLAAAALWLTHPSPGYLTAGMISLLAAGLYSFLSLYRLRKKLHHAADTDFATPPPAKN